MQKMEAINIDKWREVNARLIIAYLDCYSKLSQDNSLAKEAQLYQSLMKFDPTRSESTSKFYNSAYTIARELGIFYEEDGRFHLSQVAKNTLAQPISNIDQAIQELVQQYAFNTEFLINDRVVHPTYLLASHFKDQIFSLDDASRLSELIPSSSKDSAKDCLNQFLKRLVVAGILKSEAPFNQYQFHDYTETLRRCTFSDLSPIEFERKYIGRGNYKNVVTDMIDRNVHVADNKSVVNMSSTSLDQSIGYNKIIYGAPGAGKSKAINDLVGEKNYIRTVFHPETQYADFIGCLKPFKDHAERITYGFRKGPFIQILEQALLNPHKSYFLVIEELNRANTAAVFGEIFQLLDRDENGQSEYPIFIQDEDLFNELQASGLAENSFIAKRELVIPSNLSIIATMNSSDQAVFPLDTAFKRRWTFEYLPLDFTNSANGTIPINDSGLPSVEWKKLAQAFNRALLQLDVVEDKLIGPWFIKNSDLSDVTTARETFIGKVCSYLWDDALKYKDKTKIFASNIKGYGQLHQQYMSGQPILSKEFVQHMTEYQNALEFGHESE